MKFAGVRQQTPTPGFRFKKNVTISALRFTTGCLRGQRIILCSEVGIRKLINNLILHLIIGKKSDFRRSFYLTTHIFNLNSYNMKARNLFIARCAMFLFCSLAGVQGIRAQWSAQQSASYQVIQLPGSSSHLAVGANGALWSIGTAVVPGG